MIGTNAESGKIISGVEHLRQSISRLLTTPVGSRIMRRDYGSYLFELLDQPGNSVGQLKTYATIVDALLRWEPRVLPTKVTMAGSETAEGIFEVDLDLTVVTDIDELSAGSTMQLTIPLGAA